MQRARALFVLGVVLAGCVLAGAAPARAHAQLERSSPIEGERLGDAPASVDLSFTEPPDPELTDVTVLDQSGASVVESPFTVGGLQVHVPLQALADGSYLVSWKTVSVADGHPSEGTLSFGVGQEPVPPGQVRAARVPPAMAIVGRVLLYMGLSLLLGLAGYTTFVAQRGFPTGTLLGVGALLVVAGVWYVVAAQAATVEVSPIRLIGTASGRPLLLQVVALVAVIVTTIWVGVRPTVVSAGALGISAASVALAHAAGSHASADTWPVMSVAVQWSHMMAVGLWIGGLAWLLPRALRSSGAGIGTTDRQREEVRRFSMLATWCILIVGASGVMRSLATVGGPGAFLAALDSTYVRMILVKIVLFIAIGVLGFLNRRRVHRGEFPLRGIVMTELMLAVVVFAATAVLSQSPPPPPPPQPVAVGTASDGQHVELFIDPARAGDNTFRLVLDAESVEQVGLEVQPTGRDDVSPSTLSLTATAADPRVWVGSGPQLAFPGSWSVDVQGQGEKTSFEASLTVSVGAAPAAPRVEIVTPQDGAVLPEGVPVLVTTRLDGSGSGHVHIYVDGELASMTDGEISMPPGEHTIEAQLASSSHATVAGGTDRVRITVGADGATSASTPTSAPSG